MSRKICLKCLDLKFLIANEEHCGYCGNKLTEFNLVCECGAEIYPYFGYRTFPPWGKQATNKFCRNCGRDIRNLVKDYVKELKNAG